jgi:hypothetical protein
MRVSQILRLTASVASTSSTYVAVQRINAMTCSSNVFTYQGRDPPVHESSFLATNLQIRRYNQANYSANYNKPSSIISMFVIRSPSEKDISFGSAAYTNDR